MGIMDIINRVIIAFLMHVLYTVAIPVLNDKIHLEKLSTIYLPYRYNDLTPIYGFATGAVEQTAYDPDNYIIYAVGANVIHAVDIKNATEPTVVYHTTVDNVDITDIEFCGGYLFVSMDNKIKKEEGRIVIYHSISSSQPMEILHNITVGSLPDMLLPTSNCKTVLIAIEAEPYMYNGSLVDPEGGVGILKIAKNVTYKKLDFKNFNLRWSELESKGLRFINRENNNLFSNDVEPEYITFNKEETKAYICLQENNAIAVVDLKTETIEDILPLGFKSWGNYKMDASDRDNGINMRPWPVFGMYQPDSIHTIEVAGESYLVTANEGDSKDYSAFGGFNEEARVEDVNISADSPILSWASQHNTSANIQNDEFLGRLKITNTYGRNANGTYDALYSFGGRGFSIWNLATMDRIYDSGSQFEELHQQYIRILFNNNAERGTDTVNQTFDTRSDDKGPECESLAVAHIGNQVVIFVGNERPGSIFIYKIDGKVSQPEFQSIWTGTGIEETDATWDALYDQRKISEIDPEDIRYIPANHSPTNKHLLVVAGTVSGTLSVFRINGVHEELSISSPNKASCLTAVQDVMVLAVIYICTFIRQ